MSRRRVSEANVDIRAKLPAVNTLLESNEMHDLLAKHPRSVVLDAVRATLTELRQAADSRENSTDSQICSLVRDRIRKAELDRLRPVVNATGVILHTNLGRAVLPQNAVDALSGLNRCCNMQIDLESGARGRRNYTTEKLICRLTGAEAAMIVNNNAAATFLVLAALCSGREVIVSRGQLIEIGGSFRLPDCITQSGAVMVEVGTTNKTHLRDYAAALTERTGALLRVNPSNYRVVGFTKEVSTAELAQLKDEQSKISSPSGDNVGADALIVIDDLGCGALIDLTRFGLPKEPTVQESLADGADIVLFSGDKLIGGPQAGIIAGRKPLIDRIKKHPLTRMLRVGKMTDLVLEHTLRLFLEPETLAQKNPTIGMLAVSLEELKERADLFSHSLRVALPNADIQVVQGISAAGGGSLPDTPIASWLVAAVLPGTSAVRLLAVLRAHEPPVIARIEDDRVVLDMRTLLPGDESVIREAFTDAASKAAPA